MGLPLFRCFWPQDFTAKGLDRLIRQQFAPALCLLALTRPSVRRHPQFNREDTHHDLFTETPVHAVLPVVPLPAVGALALLMVY